MSRVFERRILYMTIMRKIIIIAFLFFLIGIAFFVFKNKIQSKFNSWFYTRNKSRKYWNENDLEQFKTKIEIPHTPNYIIGVWKADHVLKVIKNSQVIKKYKVNLRNEGPDRLLENDNQTPEGIFKVYEMAVVTRPAWARWIAFDTTEKSRKIFVNEFQNGQEILNNYEKKHGKITNDKDIRQFNLKHPETPYLRGFGIHGGGYYPGCDWTIGCPALNDEDVIELYELLKTNPNGGLGTLVIIQD